MWWIIIYPTYLLCFENVASEFTVYIFVRLKGAIKVNVCNIIYDLRIIWIWNKMVSMWLKMLEFLSVKLFTIMIKIVEMGN